jgi:mannose-6-phosphate isomerase-like protein (cupin superfamily)
MINKEILNKIIEHKKNRKVFIIKNFNKDVPSWSDFINYLDKSSNIKPNLDDGSMVNFYVKGTVMSKEHLYYYMLSHGHMNKSSKDIELAMSKAFNVSGGMSGVFINFSSNMIDVRPHSDPQDNFYWQCIGSTEWVFDNKPHIVEPGDIVFVPAYANHAVNFFMPRAAITFCWDLEEHQKVLDMDEKIGK